MADNKITELTANTAPQPTDLLVMEDDPGGVPLTQKITIADFFKVINALTEETVMDTAADLVVIYDASAGAVRKVKLTNLRVGGGRELLTANRTYYVRTDGSDSNTGLANTAGGAFLTIQKAIDVATSIDLSIYNVTIQVGNGTYTGSNTLKPRTGGGTITIQGDTTTPSNVVVSTTSADCFSGLADGYIITGFKLQTTTSGVCVRANNCVVTLGVINFGACANYHAYADRLGYILFSSSYTISGGAQFHWLATYGSYIDARNLTITFTTNPTNFSDHFANCGLSSGIYVPGNTFTNKAYATGAYYYVNRNSVIDTGGGGATYLPGNSAGSTASGGQYV